MKLSGGGSVAEKLLIIISHVDKYPASRSAKAWELVMEKDNQTIDKGDIGLFKDIYLYAFSNSSRFFRCSKLGGSRRMLKSSVERVLHKRVEIPVDDHDNSRHSRINRALYTSP